MKIGILTYHRAHNFGAVLQAYALRTFLKSKGNEVEFIDYWPKYRNGMYDLFSLDFKNKSVKENIKQTARMCFSYFKKRDRYNRFESFITDYLEVSNKNMITEGSQIEDKYDYIVFGSDQIWRYNEFLLHKGFDEVYWGIYPKKSASKKITYAASMGKMAADKIDKNILINYLDNFEAISIRELKLKNYIDDIYKKDTFHVLDPVFLIEKKQWEELADNSALGDNYLLLYNLNASRDATILAEKFADEKKLKIKELTGSVRPFLDEERYKQRYGPLEFLGAIRNAEFVVATSFHGVAFSILFEKQFVALGMKDNAERVKGLLFALGIEDHYIDDIKSFSMKRIDYKNVNLKLKDLKQYSKGFINDNLR